MANKLLCFSVLLILLMVQRPLWGQTPEVVEFSGRITDTKNRSIPYVHVYNRNSYRGTISDYWGNFAFAVRPNDTIWFSAVGYKRCVVAIPRYIDSYYYQKQVVMQTDTILLDETIVHPYQNYHQFKQAVIYLDLPEDDYERAVRNIANIVRQEKLNPSDLGPGGNYKNYMQQHYDRIYHAGQPPPINFLNPLAWAKFFKALQNGDFKQEDDDD